MDPIVPVTSAPAERTARVVPAQAAPLHGADEMRFTASGATAEASSLAGVALPAGHPPVSLERPAGLRPEELANVAQKKATCPFIGSAVAGGALPVLNDATNPLASVERVRQLGDSGGGDLGSHVLVLFAQGNHAMMQGPDGKLDTLVPPGTFSLDFPGSQGSHPGHSGILQGNPLQRDTGRLSESDLHRLTSRADANGLIKLSDVGAFIAENLRRDSHSKVFGGRVATLLGKDLLELSEATPAALLSRLTGSHERIDAAHRELCEKVTRLTGEDNLIGSAGEFGLLFAFVAHKPGAEKVEGEPTVSVADVRSMFVDKQFPAGWETWPKYGIDWVTSTTKLLISAGKAYVQNPGYV